MVSPYVCLALLHLRHNLVGSATFGNHAVGMADIGMCSIEHYLEIVRISGHFTFFFCPSVTYIVTNTSIVTNEPIVKGLMLLDISPIRNYNSNR
jgi:hypothetical protein